MRFSKLLIAVAVVAPTLALGLPASVRADIIFDNLGSGFVSSGGGTIDSVRTRHAMRFTVSAGSNLGFTLTSVEFPLHRFSGTFDQIDLSVYSDNAGQPGAALETVTISGITNTATLFTASFSGGTFLADGTTYWVVAQHLGGSSGFTWIYSIDQSGSRNGNRAAFSGVWTTGQTGDLGLTVNGTPVAGPVGLTQDLIVDVVDLNLVNGIANSLDAKLDSVVRALDDLNENNDVAACNALEGFINAVEAQSGNHISVDDAVALIEDTQQIIALLGCSP